MKLLALIWVILAICKIVFMFCAGALHTSKYGFHVRAPEALRWARMVTKWPALAGIIADPFLSVIFDANITALDYLSWIVSAVIWWILRNGDDDDLKKKLKDKLREKVEQVGARLVIVPNPATP